MLTCKKFEMILFNCPNWKNIKFLSPRESQKPQFVNKVFNHYVAESVIPNLEMDIISIDAHGAKGFPFNRLEKIMLKSTYLESLNLRDAGVSEMVMMDIFRIPCPADCGPCNGMDGSHTKRIKKINISRNNNVTDKVLELIGIRCTNVNHLNLSDLKRFTDHGLISLLTPHIGPNLLFLSLNRNDGLKNESLVAIGSSCKELRTLECSSLFFVDDVGFQAILKGCLKISHIDLSFCWRITNDCFSCLLTKSDSDQLIGAEIKTIKLQFCYQLSDLTVHYLLRIPSISAINISNCTEISANVIDNMKARGIKMIEEA
jgi:hypothetical protein